MPQITKHHGEGKKQDLQPAGWAAFSYENCHFSERDAAELSRCTAE